MKTVAKHATVNKARCRSSRMNDQASRKSPKRETPLALSRFTFELGRASDEKAEAAQITPEPMKSPAAPTPGAPSKTPAKAGPNVNMPA